MTFKIVIFGPSPRRSATFQEGENVDRLPEFLPAEVRNWQNHQWDSSYWRGTFKRNYASWQIRYTSSVQPKRLRFHFARFDSSIEKDDEIRRRYQAAAIDELFDMIVPLLLAADVIRE